VGEGLRDGWRRQLEECHGELGFTYLRMHGLLHDELGVYSENADGTPRYNWQYIDDVYDFLLSIGMKPFVEISFMPGKLASGTATQFWWQANITPPKDYAKWDALVTALVTHWTQRYGAEEVKTWRFEIWNEPNLVQFWHPQDLTTAKPAYIELYEHTAKDVKSVNPAYLVGGPAGAGPSWVKDLVAACEAKSLPLDFISFHAYGLGGGPSGLDEFGTKKFYLNPNLHAVAKIATGPARIIAKSANPKLPVYVTEWSTSYSPRDPIHDSYFSAPFILEQLRNTESIGSMSYWTFTDVFEEGGPPTRPFHGGFGLINYQGIRKPSFWAYRFLSQLGPTELRNTDASSYACTDGHGGVQVLLWNLTDPTQGGKIANQDYFFQPHPAGDKGQVHVDVKGMASGKYELKIYRIGYKQNDPYTRYLEMGSPSNLSREDVAALKKLSAGAPVSDQVVNVTGDFTETLPMQENGVYFLTLTPQPT